MRRAGLLNEAGTAEFSNGERLRDAVKRIARETARPQQDAKGRVA